MPGYVIHLAIAKEYARNHRVKDEKEFFKGTLAPDLLAQDNKNKTHYSKEGSPKTDLKMFLKENKINDSYMEGYFLHLIVDHLFYNYYFPNYSKKLYNDYDITNKELIEKYEIKLPEEIKECVKFKDGELEVLEREKLYQMIEEIPKRRLSDYKFEIKKDGRINPNPDGKNLEPVKPNNKSKIVLAVVIAILCIVMLFFINQKEGFHCDEIFSYGSANSAYENTFYSYREKTAMHKLIEEKIMQDGNVFDWIKRTKYYFVDHTDEKDEFIAEKTAEEKMIWRTSDDAKNYLEAKDNRFNFISVYYNQVQDVHPPLFYMIVHLVCSIFNNVFSKYIIFFISLPLFIGTCILIWKILNLVRQKRYFNINSYFIWIKYGSNFNYDVPKNVYDVDILLNSISIFKYIHIEK